MAPATSASVHSSIHSGIHSLIPFKDLHRVGFSRAPQTSLCVWRSFAGVEICGRENGFLFRTTGAKINVHGDTQGALSQCPDRAGPLISRPFLSPILSAALPLCPLPRNPPPPAHTHTHSPHYLSHPSFSEICSRPQNQTGVPRFLTHVCGGLCAHVRLRV